MRSLHLGYYLSNKNKAKIRLHLLELEKKQTILFEDPNPTRLLYILRQAVNTTHFHLKDLYKFRLVKGVGVRCIYEPPLLSLSLKVELKDVSEEVDYWRIASDISLDSYNLRYLNPQVSDEEFIELQLLCETKGLKIQYTNSQIEITK